MEVYEKSNDADLDIIIKSKWLLDYIHEISAFVDGPKNNRGAKKAGESSFCFNY